MAKLAPLEVYAKLKSTMVVSDFQVGHYTGADNAYELSPESHDDSGKAKIADEASKVFEQLVGDDILKLAYILSGGKDTEVSREDAQAASAELLGSITLK